MFVPSRVRSFCVPPSGIQSSDFSGNDFPTDKATNLQRALNINPNFVFQMVDRRDSKEKSNSKAGSSRRGGGDV